MKILNYKLKIAYILLFCLTLTIASNAQLIRDTTILKPIPRITGWADNDHYIVENWNSTTKVYDAFSVDIKSGAEKPYSKAALAKVLSVDIADGDIVLISEKEKKKLTQTKAVEKLPELSPDKNWIAFLRNNDLYVLEIATGKEIRFTNDGSETILNGYASWVYYEEILGRGSKYRAFWWSPDSKHIAFYRFDDSNVPMFLLYSSVGQHGFTEKTRYPKAGDPNPEVQFGIASVAASTVVWANFNPKEDQYFGTPFWRPDGSGVIVQWMPREQNNFKLYDIHLASGNKKEIYNEKQNTWIDWIDRMKWLKNGFIIIRDFDGWEQIYYHGLDGTLKAKLTSGKNWNTKIVRVDEKTNTLFYTADAELSTRTDLYSVQLNGKNQKRLSFGAYTHDNIFLSPDGKKFITSYSNSLTPTRIAIVDTRNGKIKEIADSKGSAFEKTILPVREIVWLKTEDGFYLPGRITWPKNRVAGKKYPVIISIYGGPGHQSVSDGWVSPFSLEEDNEIIKVGIEHRGSGHVGKNGLNYLHRNLGKWEMADYIAWVKWLRQNPNVDADKIMITGGSYGGYLTAMALTYGAEYFNYGLANYSVTDWALYDSHYTERYMDTPKDNPEGYKFGSVLTHANKYNPKGSSMLLLQHGMMDDNVHVQNTYQLADALQRLNKPFEMMIYPGERHGWMGPKIKFTTAMRNQFIDKYLINKK
ncbi:MAG: S9 family peptidase [Chitinophagaceae bacterium]|nr:MAG: S9 family peptidase [Chitinophagaceae bacterium]